MNIIFIQDYIDEVNMNNFELKKETMINRQLIPRGIYDKKVLNAIREVPREVFVPKELKELAYEDRPLEIGFNQTISQPYIVALMLQEAHLKSEDIVLEIGGGSGYAAAVASKLVKAIYTVEIIPALADRMKTTLKRLGYNNIAIIMKDGSQGYSEKTPYDVILVAARAEKVPPALIEQLNVGGRLIIPIGLNHSQKLIRIIKKMENDLHYEVLGLVNFVPLIIKPDANIIK
ncbi:MAG: pcm [Francisellaceae bacterium]|nr:pcm [Francisellaceae bacterium]